ncbi:hypothetical protein HPB50_013102 [Hyalomma asiaticum]|uniref:Uncharacterized protein n=1 Tax=Hyalomma asiaticum TaxID=266040 RepID=A0ACB7RV27_HYAAI|nr:hypothetical protein HPB50_013102 [Hyalomma asiaticum]
MPWNHPADSSETVAQRRVQAREHMADESARIRAAIVQRTVVLLHRIELDTSSYFDVRYASRDTPRNFCSVRVSCPYHEVCRLVPVTYRLEDLPEQRLPGTHHIFPERVSHIKHCVH